MSAQLTQALQALIVLKLGDGTRAARGEAAVLESALDVLASEPIVCDHKGIGPRSHRSRRSHRPASPNVACCGPVHRRTCADCGYAITRCEMHGGRKSVSRWMWLHGEQHGRV